MFRSIVKLQCLWEVTSVFLVTVMWYPLSPLIVMLHGNMVGVTYSRYLDGKCSALILNDLFRCLQLNPGVLTLFPHDFEYQLPFYRHFFLK